MIKETVIAVIDNGLKTIESKHNLEIAKLKYENEKLIKKMNDIEEHYLKKEKEMILAYENSSNKIRWDESGEYYNLKDFCIASKFILFFKENELKQYLLECNHLVKDKNNGKYIPNLDSDICILIDGEIYIKYSFIRSNLMFLRTAIFIGNNDEMKKLSKIFYDNQDILTEKMGNTVYVDCKQRSHEFRNCRENKYFIGNECKKQIK